MNRQTAAEILAGITKEKIIEGGRVLSCFLTFAKLDHKEFIKMKPAKRSMLMAAFLIEYGRKSAKENDTE